MSLLEVLILSIVQGITEFLPVSSSGHLVVADSILRACGFAAPQELLEVSIVLHLGTLLAVLVYYRERIGRLLHVDRRVIPLLIVGTIPAAIVGVGIKKLLPDSTQDAILENPLLAGLMFPVTALLLLWSLRRQGGQTEYPGLNWKQALLIGLFQSIAILPGISRSGATIVAGLVVGLRRDASAAFAFLLAIPAIGGACLLEALDMLEAGGSSTAPSILLIGLVASFIVGWASLALLVRLVERGKLAWFALWLIPLGIGVTAWQLAVR
jgi:undecaprenyl-diphosphatase